MILINVLSHTKNNIVEKDWLLLLEDVKNNYASKCKGYLGSFSGKNNGNEWIEGYMYDTEENAIKVISNLPKYEKMGEFSNFTIKDDVKVKMYTILNQDGVF